MRRDISGTLEKRSDDHDDDTLSLLSTGYVHVIERPRTYDEDTAASTKSLPNEGAYNGTKLNVWGEQLP